MVSRECVLLHVQLPTKLQSVSSCPGGGVLHHEVPDVCILWINGSLGAKQKTGACPSPVLHSDD